MFQKIRQKGTTANEAGSFKDESFLRKKMSPVQCIQPKSHRVSWKKIKLFKNLLGSHFQMNHSQVDFVFKS